MYVPDHDNINLATKKLKNILEVNTMLTFEERENQRFSDTMEAERELREELGAYEGFNIGGTYYEADENPYSEENGGNWDDCGFGWG